MNTSLITDITNGIGHIILNSEKTLNALSQTMAEELLETLAHWEKDSSIYSIFLEGSGTKAFCAGGDIKNLYLALRNDDERTSKVNPTCLKFFLTEYYLDYRIHTYSKPIITWNSGITMGGGMGLMNGASHRIVTETSLLAMPEVSIGLYPDVGATYFFNKLPPGVAQFLGVTGARFNGSDALALGLADFYLTSSCKERLFKTLQSLSWKEDTLSNKKLINSTLTEFKESHIPQSQVAQYLPDFKRLEHTTNISEFSEITNTFPDNAWIKKSLEIFQKGSPSSAAIILEQLKRGKNLSLKEVFKSELNLSIHCALRNDFPEGVRSLLIDKDQAPKWNPANIHELSQEWINSYFTPIWKTVDHPFNDWID